MSGVADAVARATGRPVAAIEPTAGGDINRAWRAELEDGTRAFVKGRSDPAPGEYAAEAAGLEWLREPGGLSVPAVLGASDEVLVLEWVDPGGHGDPATLGRGLATVHAAGAPTFGGARELRLGAAELPNGPLPTWPEFYARRRLEPLARQARDRGPCRPPARRRSIASANASTSSPAPRSRPPACTATCGAATCCGIATVVPG